MKRMSKVRESGRALRDAHTDIKWEDHVVDYKLGFVIHQKCPDLGHEVAGNAVALQLPQECYVVYHIVGPLDVQGHYYAMLPCLHGAHCTSDKTPQCQLCGAALTKPLLLVAKRVL